MNCLDLKTSVIDSDLCCGCGACVGVCPAGALTIDVTRSHTPAIDESKCTDCGLCLDVCPGKGYAIAERSRNKLDDGARLVPGRGPVMEYLAGHSTDPEIRASSSSGGIATSLLVHLLESGQVDSAMTIVMENERPVARLTSDIQEIRNSPGSKYEPVPMLAGLISELMKEQRRVAVTFTPCQLAGWQEAARRIPRLRESTVVAIGLFCGYIQAHDVLEGIASRLGLEYPDGARFTHWRHGAYPGSLRFERCDGTSAAMNIYRALDIAVPHFSLNRCFLCPEGGNWLADMTLGDIHAGGDDETVIVCRTKRGRDALASAAGAERIVTRKLTQDQAERSVIRHITQSKLMPAIARNAWLRKKGRPAPEFDYDTTSLPEGGYRTMAILQVWKYRLTLWFRAGRRKRFLKKHPSLMERTGRFLYTFPNSIPGWKLMIRARSLLRK